MRSRMTELPTLRARRIRVKGVELFRFLGDDTGPGANRQPSLIRKALKRFWITPVSGTQSASHQAAPTNTEI